MLQLVGSRRVGSEVLVHGLRCPVACEILWDLEADWCSLCSKVDFEPLDHSGKPSRLFWLFRVYCVSIKIFKVFVLVLVKMSWVFLLGLHRICRMLEGGMVILTQYIVPFVCVIFNLFHLSYNFLRKPLYVYCPIYIF